MLKNFIVEWSLLIVIDCLNLALALGKSNWPIRSNKIRSINTDKDPVRTQGLVEKT